MTYLDALKKFLEYLKEVERSPKTIELYTFCLTKYHDNLSGKLNRLAYIDEIAAQDFEAFLYESPNDKRFSQSTRQAYATAFKSFFTFCYMKGLCKQNIGEQLLVIRARPKERTYISEEEMLLLADAMKTETDKVLVQTLFYAGLRISEAVGLTIEDVNFQENYIYVRKRKTRNNRKVPLSIKLQHILMQYYTNYRCNADFGGDSFFILHRSLESTTCYFNEKLKKAAKTIGIKGNISSHIMRHSFASNLVAKGVDVVKIKKLLGHENLRTTNIYLHTNTRLLKNAVDKL